MSALQKRFALLLSVLSVLGVVVVFASVFAWWQLRGSRAQLDGTTNVAGLSAPVSVTRDALGVPTITAANRADVARALGFLHAQDRFFQMDLLRRSGAGELAELVGEAAVPLDRAHRLHGFRATAQKVLATLPADQHALLDAYTAGVNAGLSALPKAPWEYLVLRTPPRAWQAADSFLVAYAMWFDLQDVTGRRELNLRSVREHLGQSGLDFFTPLGNSWDAALDGTTIPPAPIPPIRLKAPVEQAALPLIESANLPGSNSFVVAGNHTANGAALLANDMHLNLAVPNTWYRAQMIWPAPGGPTRRLNGLTLPGLPMLITGSNGHLAWGFTNAYVDTSDLVLVEMEPTVQIHYRTPNGWAECTERTETINVKGKQPVTLKTRWTEWGPIIGQLADNRALVLRWNAHDAISTNLHLLGLETANTTATATALAPTIGMPNQNLLVADDAGAIAWTLTGTIPHRVGFTGREPVSWAFGDRTWDGYLPATDIPSITKPTNGFLWSANQRPLGGEALAKLGDGGYDDGARAKQICKDLQVLIDSGKKITPADLLAIQLDDRALFLTRWHELLLHVLSDDSVRNQPDLQKMLMLVKAWDGHASTDSAAYRIVRDFRNRVTAHVLEPFFATATLDDEPFSYADFHSEDAVWRLVQEQPIKLLNPAYASWDRLLIDSARTVTNDAEKESGSLAAFTWGARNTLRMRHPLSASLPGVLAHWLDLPAQPLPGDHDLPRVQGPSFGASERLVVSPGHEADGILEMPGGQSGHPLSPYYRAGHDAWMKGEATPLLPGPVEHTLTLQP